MEKPVLTFSEAAEYTGLSKSYLYKLTSLRKVPHYKSQGGKLTYFDKKELEDWMLSNRVATITEIEKTATSYVVTGKR